MAEPPLTVKALFQAAVEITSPAQRNAYLDRACAHDPELRKRLEALLEAHEAASNFLEPPDCPGPAGAARPEEPRDSRATTDDNPDPSELLWRGDPRPGSRVGRYKLLHKLDKGGMGIVYRARDDALGRDVAVKVLSDRYTPDSPAAQRFVNEARITGQLQHPGIPAVHEVGSLPDGRPFLAMKLIRGDTLEDLLGARSDPSAERGRLLAVFEGVCQAVAYAHTHRVIHRDLKPSNIMVGAFGEVQVLDWGLAKVLGQEAPPPQSQASTAELTATRTEIRGSPQVAADTQAGSVVGTLAFMPPEQAAGELSKVDERADVFGLGALLAVILTGKPPYLGETSESLWGLAVRGQLDGCFARLEASGAEPALLALCQKCLAFEPADRPRHAGEVAQAVAGLRSAAEERARRAEREKAAAEARAAEQRRKRRWQFAAAGLLVLALVGAILGLGAYLQAQARANADLEAENFQRKLAEDRAIQERNAARQARDEEVRQRGLAEAQERTTRRHLYGAQLESAVRARQTGRLAQLAELLHAMRPDRPGGEDLRGWEWYHLYRLYRSEAARYAGHAGQVQTAVFSPDGHQVASADDQGVIVVWDAASGSERARLTGFRQAVRALAWSPDGRTLASGSGDQSVRVWDLETGKERFVLRGHTERVTALAFHPTEDRLFSASNHSSDGTVRVWDLKIGLLPPDGALRGGRAAEVSSPRGE